MLETFSGNEKHAFQVRVDELIPVRIACFFQRDACWIYACAVEHMIDLAELANRSSYESLHLLRGTDICFLRK